MDSMNTKYTLKFMEKCPTILGSMVNSHGQVIIFFEHPVLGDSTTVYGMIDGVLFDTGFYEVSDMEVVTLDGIDYPSDYTPILKEGKVLPQFKA